MKWVNSYRMRLMLFVFLAVIVLGSGELSNADFTFGTPMNLGSAVNTSAREEEPCISSDGLSLYYCSLQAGGYGNYDLWVTSRLTTEDNWGPPVNLGPTVNSSSADFTPEVSADGLMLYFVSDRPGGYGSYDLWVTRRATKQDNWGTPVNLGSTINKTGMDACMGISDDGLELYFWSDRPGGYGSSDIWVTRRATIEESWSMPVNLGPTVNSSATDLCSDISCDSLLLFFASKRSGGYGGNYGDIWITRRATISDPWGPPVNLGPMVNTSASETGPALSGDGSILYFGSDRPGGFGGWDIWQVSITPVIDFNGDGIIDAADMCIMIDHWGENYSLCDIGPTPLGDGIVDTQDLIVLSEHLFEDINDPTLAAHWALDETEGMFVFDSAGDNDGYALGDPVWRPDAGLVDGALQLDGVYDHIITGAALNPTERLFSVLVWVNGGAPGQVVMSQQGAANWLMADAEGNLMTGLKGSGRDAAELTSQAIITDGDWHRICFVWDGVNRILYVDSIAVAQDTQDGLGGSDSGLYIGCGKGMEPGTYFSGLIDDVRIYNRAVRP